jgi:ERCC4-type nuclease
VEAVVTASADALAAVDGIGEKAAAKVRWAVQEPVADYITTPGVTGAIIR